jgi:hypothetical protein
MVGDYYNEVNLNTVITRVKEFITFEKNRSIDRLNCKKKEDVFSTIYCSVYGQKHACEGISENLVYDVEYNIISEYRKKYLFIDLGDASFIDTIAGVIINDEILQAQRIIWENFDDLILREIRIPFGHFENICKEFIKKVC